jgi:hypothetical protein
VSIRERALGSRFDIGRRRDLSSTLYGCPIVSFPRDEIGSRVPAGTSHRVHSCRHLTRCSPLRALSWRSCRVRRRLACIWSACHGRFQILHYEIVMDAVAADCHCRTGEQFPISYDLTGAFSSGAQARATSDADAERGRQVFCRRKLNSSVKGRVRCSES